MNVFFRSWTEHGKPALLRIDARLRSLPPSTDERTIFPSAAHVHELKNLIADPEHAPTVAAMKQKLARFPGKPPR
jgi:hypothetical protein